MRVIVGLITLVVALYVGRALWQFFHSPTLQDFEVYYTAAQDITHLRNPYQNPNNNYVYPPSSFGILLPLAFFPYQLALPMWLGTSIALLVFSMYLIFYILKKQAHVFHVLFASLLALAAFPTKFTLGMGQMNIVVLFLIVLTIFFSQKRKSLYAGFALGVAAGIKIFPLFFLLWFIFKREYKTAGITLATFLFLNVLPVLFLGQTILKDFFAGELLTLGGWENAEYYNQALSGFLLRLHLPLPIVQITTFTLLFVLLVSLFQRISQKILTPQDTLLEWGTLLCIWLMTQPVAWQHYFVILTLPMTVLGKMYVREKNWRMTGILAVLYLAAALNIKGTPNFGLFNPFIYSHLFFATVGVFLLLVLRLNDLRKYLS